LRPFGMRALIVTQSQIPTGRNVSKSVVRIWHIR
jgi:hypothetical protein